MVYLVTIKGTWSRTNTERHEVFWYRRRLRERFRSLGGDLDFTLPHSQKDPAKLSGTFVLSLPLDNTTYMGNNQVKMGRVAKLLADAIILKQVCRPPKLSVDHNKTKVAKVWGDAKGLL